jgi:hypothetical protein
MLFAASAFVCPAARSFAQNNASTLAVTVVTTSGSPSGTDFQAGVWVNTTLSYTVTCDGNRQNWALRINRTAALTQPATSVTQLQYSFDGGAFTAVPSTATQLGASIPVSKSGTIVLRYQLGWAPSGANAYTPAGSYSLPIQLTLQQGQP